MPTTALPGGAVGAGYQQPVQATGGVPPYSFTFRATGNPPPGLTMQPNGVIAGVPTTPGTYRFSVMVRDAENTVARMEERIRRALARGRMPERDLKDAVHVERVGLWVFETAVLNLQKGDEVAVDTVTTAAGHSRKTYRLRSAPTSAPTSMGAGNGR